MKRKQRLAGKPADVLMRDCVLYCGVNGSLARLIPPFPLMKNMVVSDRRVNSDPLLSTLSICVATGASTWLTVIDRGGLFCPLRLRGALHPRQVRASRRRRRGPRRAPLLHDGGHLRDADRSIEHLHLPVHTIWLIPREDRPWAVLHRHLERHSRLGLGRPGQGRGHSLGPRGHRVGLLGRQRSRLGISQRSSPGTLAIRCENPRDWQARARGRHRIALHLPSRNPGRRGASFRRRHRRRVCEGLCSSA